MAELQTAVEGLTEQMAGQSASIVKKIQRGETTAAKTVTIGAVDMSKTIVLSVSKGSAGQVAVSGSISTSGYIKIGGYKAGAASGGILSSSGITVNGRNGIADGDALNPAIVSLSGSINGGTTNLTVREYSAKLISPTELLCDGPVEWQVIEFN